VHLALFKKPSRNIFNCSPFWQLEIKSTQASDENLPTHDGEYSELHEPPWHTVLLTAWHTLPCSHVKSCSQTHTGK